VQNRNAMLAIIPAGSTAVAGWLIGAAMLAGLVRLERRHHGENQNVIATSTFVHVTTDGEVSTDE
jgi:hypothetical protein